MNVSHQQINIGTQAQRFGQVRIDRQRSFGELFGILGLVFLEGRETFAHGALRAAQWAVKQPPGLYDMQEVLGLR